MIGTVNESMPEMVGATQLAEILGVTAARVRQMVAEQKLPEPIKAGDRAAVWPARVVRDFVAFQTGQSSVPVSVLHPATAALERVYDQVLSYERDSWVTEYRTCRAHVRVWAGPASEGHRIVVLLGDLTGEYPVQGDLEELVATVDHEVLRGSGWQATWLIYQPQGSIGRRHVVTPKIFHQLVPERLTIAERFGSLLRGSPASTENPWGHATYGADVSVARIEQLVGGAIECWPKEAYTAENVDLWHRAGRIQIEVELDTLQFRSLMSDVAAVEAAQDGPDGLKVDVLDHAAKILATVARERLDMEANFSRYWNDGTVPDVSPALEFPTRFAARLVPVAPTVLDLQRLDRYNASPFPWPQTPAAVDRSRPLLEAIRSASESVDKDADTPNLRLCTALGTAADLLADQMRRESPDFASIDVYPTDRPLCFYQVGPHDASYLATVTWDQNAGTSRRRRRLANMFWTEERPNLRYGRDVHLRLVAVTDPSKPHTGGFPTFAVEWPTTVSAIGPQTVAVADSESGDRPVYLLHGDSVDLLPRQRGDLGGWNFGYGGGSPGSLAAALARGLGAPDALHRVISDYVRRPSDSPEFRMHLDHYRGA